MALDTLEIFGTEFTNVTGIKATDDQSGTKVYIRPQGTKSISANGSGIDVVNYASVDVNVPSGTSKNTQVVQGMTKANSPTMMAMGDELIVSTTGTYDIYYSCFRTNVSSSHEWATRLYINGTAYGTAENATWTSHQQNNHLSNISLTAGDKLRVYGRETRGTTYFVGAPMLVIVEA